MWCWELNSALPQKPLFPNALSSSSSSPVLTLHQSTRSGLTSQTQAFPVPPQSKPPWSLLRQAQQPPARSPFSGQVCPARPPFSGQVCPPHPDQSSLGLSGSSSLSPRDFDTCLPSPGQFLPGTLCTAFSSNGWLLVQLTLPADQSVLSQVPTITHRHRLTHIDTHTIDFEEETFEIVRERLDLSRHLSGSS